MNDEKLPAGEIKPRSPFLKRLDNFFYHYKWHTIVCIFLAVIILIVSLQTCSREPYDIEVMYAGPHNLSDRQTVLDIQNVLAQYTDDTNEDGEKDVRLVSYWVNEELYKNDSSTGVNTQDMAYLANSSLSNEKAFMGEITASNLSICLLSPYLFEKVDAEAGFMRVTDIYPALAEFEETVCVYDENGKINRFGIRLSETALGQMPGLSELPEDTILCIRKKSINTLNASRVEKQHAHALTVFERLLTLGEKTEE